MSIARLIALMAARPRAEFVAWAQAGESATTAPLPVGSKVGDLLVITYYSGASISGGSGTAFNTYSFTDTHVSWRVIEAGDLTNPINFSRTTPAISGTWRGPTRLSTAVSSATIGGVSSVPGITPSANAIGIYGSAVSSTGVPAWFTPMQHTLTQSTSGLGYGAASIETIENYTPGTAFVNLCDGSGMGQIFEMLL